MVKVGNPYGSPYFALEQESRSLDTPKGYIFPFSRCMHAYLRFSMARYIAGSNVWMDGWIDGWMNT